MIIRGGASIFRTEEQQHSFNFPYQLGTGSKDRPCDAQFFTVQIQEGDLVLVGSDGLFDNLFDEDILSIIHSITGGTSPSHMISLNPFEISSQLAKRAKEVAEDTRYASSPFQSRALQEGREDIIPSLLFILFHPLKPQQLSNSS